MSRDLYDLPIEGADFTNFCGGNLSGEHESCVEVARIPGEAAAFAIRDSKPEGAGRELRFTGAELDEFVIGYATRRGLKL
ncbi:DUF397 domain-containing protein [Streptomyces litchfieldiae]|uniref:DUF397 domain-containing protein n=1 Tax=Streptomyces litchfieldiae TaxID=3075543 RepID=A0ABU2MJC7_9ACTN|nr:DUF397 domain-containing protein [Streptomyces sp. DSM 44938]MDT0341581.1 DUF397 domain-containing protein [Streptomyces sp. DSM 44938]